MSSEPGLWQAAPMGPTFPSDRGDIWRLCFNSLESPDPDFSGILSKDGFARAFHEGVTFFLRKDGDLGHFHFYAASPMGLQREAATFTELKTERVLTDLVGRESELGDLLALVQSVGLRRHARLHCVVRRGLTWEAE